MGKDSGVTVISKRTALVLASLLLFEATREHSLAQTGGWAGAYGRMGFGARGIGMANAMTAVSSGEVQGYYNPAILPYAEFRSVTATFGILSLDRRLNFLSYSQALPPEAGLSVAIINSGVGEIDARDSDGAPDGILSTSENQFILGFATKFKAGFSAGVNIKILHHHLYTDVNSVTVGIDLGLFAPLGENFRVGASVRDINSKYKWDTGAIYGQSGNTTTDDFPLLYGGGISYLLPDTLGTIALDVEASNQSTLVARGGIEVNLIPQLTVRGGVDRIDLREKGNGIRPAAGFTVRQRLGESMPLVNPDILAVNYAYVFEPFASSGIHLISLSVVF
jgi:hypothetical protein